MTFPMNLRVFAFSRNRVSLLLLVFALIGLHAGVVMDASAEADRVTVTEDGLVSADIVNLPLKHVLADFSQKLHINIKGNFNGDERVTLHFSRLNREEALRRIMADYNYALVEPERAGSGPLTVTVLGKADKTVKGAAAPPPPATNGPAALTPLPATTAPPLPEVQPPPSALQGEGAPSAVATTSPPSADITATPPGVLPAPADQPEFNPAAWGGRGRRK